VNEDLPWFVKGGTVAPELYKGGTFPPWLMNGGTFAPGLVDDGEIDGGYLADEWADEGLPGIEALELDNGANATPVFRENPFVEYERVNNLFYPTSVRTLQHDPMLTNSFFVSSLHRELQPPTLGAFPALATLTNSPHLAIS